MEKEGIFSAEKNDSGKIPNQRELEKELSDYLTKKYGNRVRSSLLLLFQRKMRP